ncbi:M16 family metallopeptidase [Sphingomonas mesophila]|uniref:M16 family metallopeptidase n=1 Tax=Sphingomonas mesophila TaxID=2303576 RepID=UPI000E581A31|nr:pitrilysin family protein [Sphingomonas mesophila]
MLARSILIATCAAGALLAAPASAQASKKASGAASVPAMKFTERKLANGLRVIGLRDTTTPNVMVSMWYEVGAKHDPAGRAGFAHLFEHILSRKTVNMPYNAINRMVDDIGGTRNASTSWDRTNYYEIVPAEYLERMMWTHAERMFRPVIDKEVFETERGVVKEELRQGVFAPPYGRLFSFAIAENIFNVIPHRRPTIGSITDLDSATLEDARAFHESYYGPDTATLIIAGNYDPATLDRLVDKYFAGMPKRPRAVPLAITTKDTPVVARTVTATGPTVPLPVAMEVYRVPGTRHPDMAALEVLDAILSSGENSRLDRALVESGLAAEASSQLVDTEETGFLAAFGIVAGGKQEAAVKSALRAAIDSLRSEGPSADEVLEAKNEILAAALGERETFSNRGFTLGEALVRTNDPRHADKRLAAIGRVTAADVRRVARTYLDPARTVSIRYIQGDGEAKGWANPTPLPTFKTPPPAGRAPNVLRAEAERDPVPGPGVSGQFVLPRLADSRLANGARVIAARTGDVPLGSVTVVVPAGAATDPANLAGRASLAAAIAEKGTATRSARDISAGLERLGASLSSGAGRDGLFFTVTAPTATLGEATTILADIVRNASFPAEDFERERKRALDGLSVAYKTPGTLAGLLVSPVVFGATPYGSISGGTPDSMARIGRQDLLDYRQSWWRPETAAIIVSGGLDPAAGTALVSRAFGDWRASGPAPAAPARLVGEPLPGRTIVVDLPGAGQAAVYAVAPGLARGDKDFYPAQIANAVLGGGSTARLFTEIRTKRSLSYGSYSDVSANLAGGTVIASAQTKNESAAEVAGIILAELQKIATNPLNEAEVGNRKTLLNGRFKRSFETSSGFNATLSNALIRGVSPEEALAYAERIDASSGPAATAAMARMLSADRVSLIVVGDSAKFLAPLRALRPNLVVIPAAKLDLARAAEKAAP